MIRLHFDFSLPAHRKRFAILTSILIALSLLIFSGERLMTDYINRNSQEINAEKKESFIRYVQKSFSTFQHEAVEFSNQLSNHEQFQQALQGGHSTEQTLFQILHFFSTPGYSVEIFDTTKSLRSWSGIQFVQTDTALLQHKLQTFLQKGPIYSYLVIIEPVRNGMTFLGYVVTKRLFDVRYPISNRFINENTFAITFKSAYDITGTLDVNSGDASASSPDFVAIPIYDTHGKALDVALIHDFTFEFQNENAGNVLQQVKHIVLLALLLIILIGITSLPFVRNHNVINASWAILTVWICRYALVAFNLPSSFIQSSIFDPEFFSSTFGFGIARSTGDLFLSASCLLITIVILFSTMIRSVRLTSSNEQNSSDASPRKKYYVIIGTILFSLILPLLLRGFAAIIHSAVFDSTYNYNDRMYIIPPFSMSVMLLGLYMIAIALVITGVIGILLLRHYVTQAFQRKIPSSLSLVIIFLISIAGSIVVGIVHPNPLLTQIERLGYLAGVTICAYFFGTTLKEPRNVFTTPSFMIFLIVSIFAFVYPLDDKVHEYERSSVENLASTIIQPADNSLEKFTALALKDLSQDAKLELFQTPEPQVLKKMAFKAWAQSSLSQEGYNCSVNYYNDRGKVISRFTIGMEEDTSSTLQDSVQVPQPVTIDERIQNSHTILFYHGYSPLIDANGIVQGGVRIEIAAGREALIGGDTPEFLRNNPSNNVDTRRRTIIYSEYSDSLLTYSSSPLFHQGISLPIIDFSAQTDAGSWTVQQVDTLTYESFFFPAGNSANGKSWISLSLRHLDIGWHLYHVLRITLFCLLCSVIVMTGIVSAQHVRGNRINISFRSKLIVAFFVVALVPTTILAYYNRQYAIERLEQSIIDQLNRETTTIATALQNQWGISSSFDLRGLTDQDAIHAANDFNIPFTIFDGESECASSTPELFRAELFDHRMPSDVYLNVVLKQKNFYSNIQSIGTLNYIVGYHPLLNESGTVYAVIAVPSLFILREIDRELVRQNAYLVGAFLFAMIVALLVGMIFSQQISSPVRQLRQATRKIGAGDFNIQFGQPRSDEFGELERSFETMLKQLQQTQAEMIKAQRESAWKEMAKQVAHEIKNPLTPIKLSIQQLRQAYEDRTENFGELLHKLSSMILEQIETLNRIASEFSRFARMPERKLESCDIHRIVREVTDLFRQYNNVTFDLQFCPNSPIILADTEELKRAFMNIIKNSIQAMEEHGSLAIATSIEHGFANLTFSDSGPGIPHEIQQRLFEPNFSTKTDGMGMGLAIVKKAIDDLGGRISIQSTPGTGTTVTITLPLLNTTS